MTLLNQWITIFNQSVLDIMYLILLLKFNHMYSLTLCFNVDKPILNKYINAQAYTNSCVPVFLVL